MIKSKWLTVYWREGLWVNNDSILVCYSLKAIVWLVIETAFMILIILFLSTGGSSPHFLYSYYMEKYSLNNLLCSTNDDRTLISGWTITLRQRWSWVRCLTCSVFFSDALGSCLCELGGCLKSARLGCEWIWLWPADALCSSLNPTDVTGYPWQPEGLELRAWLETNSGWKEGQLLIQNRVFAPETNPIRTL